MHSCDIYYNMLQTEKSIEAGFFSNSHATMNLEVLKEEIEEKMNFKVELRFKVIYRGKMAVERED